ncbi:hypothetical protein Godav_004303 [Gossypium davidsonii]|uniref:Uncharacterized protein n=1 Tax=Gossypium davidsonii TaxID=34287 RepID=A0A7J8SLG2_GOSDV|nr:hypothetical protein [Gossypium davidsonii]
MLKDLQDKVKGARIGAPMLFPTLKSISDRWKYSVISARVLAIYVVLTLLIPVQEKFPVTDVANLVILVCHVVGHLEKLRKPLTIGHLACATSVVKEGTLHMNALLVGKRNRESSTPNLRSRLENKDLLGYKSAPHDNGKSRCKRKKIQFEEKGFNTPREEKKRGGWITEDPGDFSYRKSTRNHWNSPSTPSNQGCYNGHILGSQSSKPKNFHRFSASRFSNLGNDEPRRTYNWW